MQKIFTVYDNKAKAYINPFFLPTQAMAIREFEYVCNDLSHMFCRFPTDYTLFMIGEFDESSGALFVSEHHENLGLAASYKRDHQTVSVPLAVASVVGEFDESSGALFVSEHHENLGLAASYKRDHQTDSVPPAVASVD